MPADIANGHIWQLVQNNGNSLLSKCTFNQLSMQNKQQKNYASLYLAYKISKNRIGLEYRSFKIYFVLDEAVED